ncbi:MAG TPA: 50S ribosomal protein L29 [Candidatus Wallbacteria bacterium]|nr:MAG: 50S ribosomal protein L29 [bacterium ADurb.Bin243]HOD43008.1 50S ribosomal protein L29 [Candidatus Wallbacteria bacterium]HPG58662.1 50S ribosomal protein L29 [Candidatus Wallbacteria bacterium]
MKSTELRKYTLDELKRKLHDFKQDLFTLRFQAVVGQLTNTAKIRQVRRDIAKVNTVITEKERGINAEL